MLISGGTKRGRSWVVGTLRIGEGRSSKGNLGAESPALGLQASDIQARCPLPRPVTQTMFSPQGSGTGYEANELQGERPTRTQGSVPPSMTQSKSSESTRVATLPSRGPELSAQEQMEGMLCRKQEMEAFGKKAANRYRLWPRGACGLSSHCPLRGLLGPSS